MRLLLAGRLWLARTPCAIAAQIAVRWFASIDTSAVACGQSRRLAGRFVAAWREANPDCNGIVRDLVKEPVPHIDAARFGAYATDRYAPAESSRDGLRLRLAFGKSPDA